MGKGYEFFEHTADVGLDASGGTLEELFLNAARGLIELLVEGSDVAPKETRPVSLSAESVEALLQAWLSELIVWFDAERFVPATFELVSVTETSLQGRVRGEQFNPDRHLSGVEVKGVTRHAFSVRRANGLWRAHLIFDV